MKQKKIQWSKILLESFFIVFSILLALGVNEWRSSSQLKNQKKETLENIKEEIEQNIAQLNSTIPYHKKAVKNLQAVIKSDTLDYFKNSTTQEAITSLVTQGVMPPNLQNTAWETAKLTNTINLIEFKKTYQLSELYKLQENGVESTWKMIAVFFLHPENFEKEKTIRNIKVMHGYLRELYKQEEYLKNRSENILKLLE